LEETVCVSGVSAQDSFSNALKCYRTARDKKKKQAKEQAQPVENPNKI
jgi:hypothetical protein